MKFGLELKLGVLGAEPLGVGVYGRRMEIPAKMMADPRLRGDDEKVCGGDENGDGDDMRLQSGGGFPLL